MLLQLAVVAILCISMLTHANAQGPKPKEDRLLDAVIGLFGDKGELLPHKLQKPFQEELLAQRSAPPVTAQGVNLEGRDLTGTSLEGTGLGSGTTSTRALLAQFFERLTQHAFFRSPVRIWQAFEQCILPHQSQEIILGLVTLKYFYCNRAYRVHVEENMVRKRTPPQRRECEETISSVR